MPIYTYSYLKSNVNGRIHNKIGKLTVPRDTINNGVKEAIALIDMRSLKRRTLLAPNLFQNVYQYACPNDVQGIKLIDIARQTDDRPKDEEWDLTSYEEFDRYKSRMGNLVAFNDHDFIRKLCITAIIDDKTLLPSTLDSITAGGGTWGVIGDATNLRADSQNFVKGNASLEFDMNSGGTTAGIQNTGLSVFDLTNYIANGSVFVWVYIVTADSNITGVTLKIGTDVNNYYTRTVTQTNENTVFQQGWNLLRFDLNGISQVGTVTLTNCKFASVYINKLAGKSAETSYRFDHIMVKNGKFYNVVYYSKFPWQNASGTYIELSTADTDYINVDADEYNLILEKCVEWAAMEAKEANDLSTSIARFDKLSKDYTSDNPSECMTMITSRHDFASIDGDDRFFGYSKG